MQISSVEFRKIFTLLHKEAVKKYDSVGPGRTLGSKLRKSCENGPLALSSHSVRLRNRCGAETCQNSLKTTVLQPKNSFLGAYELGKVC